MRGDRQLSAARELSVGDARVLVLPDEAAVSHEAIELIVAALRDAIDARGEAHLALTGGTSAVSLHRELASSEWQTALAWENVHLWWGDDRFVPIDHPESNAGLAYRTLIQSSVRFGESGGTGAAGTDIEAGIAPGLSIDPGKVHPMRVEEALEHAEPATHAAARYIEDLERLLPRGSSGIPSFDVFLTGIGPDGHILSVFPGSPALADDAPLVMAIPAPTHVEPHLPRVTLSTRMLAAARVVLVLTAGESKAQMLADVLGPQHDPARWPAQTALLPHAVWLVDEAAATRLR